MDEKNIYNVARKLLIDGCQTLDKRDHEIAAAWKEALEFIGINATVVVSQQRVRFGGDENEVARAEEFKQRIRKCFPLGEYEREERAVRKALEEWKEKAVQGASNT